jgi:hypothetical protein
VSRRTYYGLLKPLIEFILSSESADENVDGIKNSNKQASHKKKKKKVISMK